MDGHSKAFSTGANGPMHVSSRDSPQSLEFWEDGRKPGSNPSHRHSRSVTICVRPAKAGMISGSKSHRGKSPDPVA
jgi:hypothetical protein